MSESSKRLLSALMVLGAQSPDRSLSVDDLAAKLGVGAPDIEAEVSRLVSAGYAEAVTEGGSRRVYLTGTGIITASSTYS